MTWNTLEREIWSPECDLHICIAPKTSPVSKCHMATTTPCKVIR